MLSNVPNISLHIATQLLAPFENDLWAFLNQIRENEHYLEEIKIQSKDNKERKLSKQIRERLMEYFGNTTL